MKNLSELILPAEYSLSTLYEDVCVKKISASSDDVGPDCLFFAIRGTKFDGHCFAKQAHRAGSIVVVEDPKEIAGLNRAVVVSSTRKAFALAASRWFEEPSQKFKLVGVTGTNGKTTVTYLLYHVWKALGLNAGLLGTVDYKIGEKTLASSLTTPGPLQLQQLFSQMSQEQVSHVAIEASSIALDQDRTAGSAFAAVAFTNLTQDHLDYHGDVETYFATKRKLFLEYGPARAVLNVDDPFGKRLSEEIASQNPILVSLSPSEFCFQSIELSAEGTRAQLVCPQGNFPFESTLLGTHNLYNCLVALGVCHALGVDLESAVSALRSALGAPGRMERVAAASDRPSVFVDYAHTPDALRNVLRISRQLIAEKGRLITVFGCGGDRDVEKRPIMAQQACEFSDVVIATSDNPRTEDPELILDDIERGIQKSDGQYVREVNRRSAIFRALQIANPQDMVVVAGKGHEDYQIIGTQTISFDDRKVIEDYYSH